MKIRLAISAVAARAKEALALAAQVDAAVYMDDPPSGNAWPNYRRALLDAGRADDWLVMLEDDAAPVAGFLTALPRALDTCPGDFANLYHEGAARMQSARANGCSWVKTIRMLHGVAWAVRAELAPEIVQWGAVHAPADYRQNDDILLGWLVDTGRWNFASAPSLVEHRADMTSVMLPGESNAPRRAGMLPEGDASLLTWNGLAHYGLQAAGERARFETAQRLRATGLTIRGI